MDAAVDTGAVDPGAVIDRLYDGLASGELEAARACLTPDARLWHGFDGVPHDPDSIMRDWALLVRNSTERRLDDVKRQATAEGFVQQHMFVLTRADGKRVAWPVCIVVRLRDGLIARLDEYIDRAGAMAVADGPVTTPGF